MSPNRQRFILLPILLLAAVLRLSKLDWDGYQHYHPDERYISWVATTIELPSNLITAFDPHRSTVNPFYWPPDAASEGIVVLRDQPRSFAYGHLPLYLGVAATRAVEAVAPALIGLLPAQWAFTRDFLNGGDYNEFHHLTAVARALTALFDVGVVGLVFLLGRQLYGAATGLLAALFLALNVMHIQLARFFTVDPYLTFFTVAAVLAAVQLARSATVRGYWRRVLVCAVAIGLAVASKFSAVLLVVPFAVALWLQKTASEREKRSALLVAPAIIAAIFVLTNPFAALDWTCELISPAVQIGPLRIPALDWRSCFLDNVLRQSAMVSGDSAFDFTRQYVGTVPYLYPIVMQVRWGMGYLLGVVAFVGFAWALWRVARRLAEVKTLQSVPKALGNRPAELVVLAWALPYFLVTGSFFVKFMRYMQPLAPFLMIFAAAALLALHGWRRRTATALVLLGTALYALAFVNTYRQDHPWNDVSRWIYANAPAGAVIASELWDDPLPSSMMIGDEFHNRHMYDYTELTWLSGTGVADDEEKLKVNLSRVAQADYLTISSNRGYGVVARLDDLYPLSHQYYERLFAGDLGFEVAYVAGRSPQLADLTIWPDRFGDTGLPLPLPLHEFLQANVDLTLAKADESFTVYDQPLAVIFYNERRLTANQMLSQFELP